MVYPAILKLYSFGSKSSHGNTCTKYHLENNVDRDLNVNCLLNSLHSDHGQRCLLVCLQHFFLSESNTSAL